ncbi:hypothetical protein K8S17_03470, partial [bacterium]|nr:hypothetical protein [bacterium]
GQEGDSYWYEMVMTTEDGEKVITKMLVSGNPDDEDSLERMIIKSGDEPAMEMPLHMGMGMGMGQGMMGGDEDDEDDDAEMPEIVPVDMGVETITVPAGTFKAHHWRIESDEITFDMWHSGDVGPYGMVKNTSEDFEMVLTGHGDDAKSLITEEPEKLEIPSFKMPSFGG